MNILIIGSGAREQAIAAALYRSPQSVHIFCCGTALNPGIEQMCSHYWVGDITDTDAIVEIAKKWQISIAIIGPEAPLEKGLADDLWRHGIPTIGPKKNLAQIETSKVFARDIMLKYHIPGLPAYQNFQDVAGVETFLSALGEQNYVVKANGLMSGKGVKVAGDHLHSFDDALSFCKALLADKQSFVIEEKLIGQEFSLMCFCDGLHIVPMPIVQDHKRAFVDDKGPNTGGMGSYSDCDHSLPFLTQTDVDQALQINKAMIQALTNELAEKYIGILYGSFIATQQGVYVIEFNARFGDPEALNVLAILESDFAHICQSLVKGNLSASQVRFARKATVCKYAVPQGYPDEPVKNVPINIGAVKDKSHLYLAAVHATKAGLLALGSRTAAYVGVEDSISAAEMIAEQEISRIEGLLFHRKDIGTEKLIRERIHAMLRLRASQCA